MSIKATISFVVAAFHGAYSWARSCAHQGTETAAAEAKARVAFLEQVGRIAGVGGWEFDRRTRQFNFTRQTLLVHDLPPDYHGTAEEAVAFYAPEARPIISAAIAAAVAEGKPWDLELPLITAKGRAIFVRTVAEVEFENGVAVRLVGAIQEITHRVLAAHALRKLSAALEQTPAAVVITDTTGAIEYVNLGFTEATGYTAGEVFGKNPRILKSGMTPTETYQKMWEELTAGHEWRGEFRNRRKDGELFWELAILSPLKDTSGKITHYIGVKENITARKAMEDELRFAAGTDKLTGLPNRALFLDRLQQTIVQSRRRADHRFAVLFLDCDRFKTINDSYGHKAGDLLLQLVARRLQTTVRAGDSLCRDGNQHVAARLGGDEFVILLNDLAAASDATLVAARVLAELSQPYQLGQHEVYCSASIGVVSSDGLAADASAEQMLQDADTAMYEAKQGGKGRYIAFDVSMRKRVQNRLDLENDLRKAAGAGQLFLLFQPIVSLRTGQTVGFESLIRWRHPTRGIVPPDEFIPIAEETGLIIPIGEWVLREACSTFARWRSTLGELAPKTISVNLSRRQLLHPNLVKTIEQVLESAGMTPRALHLEVTESTVMKDAAEAIRTLEQIKAMGVRLDMDDFGTGYSSLACLHQFPIDVLKIDRAFVANISRGREFAALVSAVIQLARNLEIQVVAEGIETAAQAMLLQSLDCEFGQGYFFARPLPADEAGRFRFFAGALTDLTAPAAVPA